MLHCDLVSQFHPYPDNPRDDYITEESKPFHEGDNETPAKKPDPFVQTFSGAKSLQIFVGAERNPEDPK